MEFVAFCWSSPCGLGHKRFNKDETRKLVEDAVVEKAYRRSLPRMRKRFRL
jgi:hypothetical protein